MRRCLKHLDSYRSFVYDIADLYKAEVSIPVAFDVAADTVTDLGGETRRRMRDRLHDGRLLQRCAQDVQMLLLGDSEPPSDDYLDFDVLSLWDERAEAVPGGTSYGSDL
ncbi:CRISPR-associated endonuclease Cas1 [Mycobacterium lacus]|uniref:hypothetical protein n=1 Tax=Mycobacterium lacus TaxID=169765 RepID=UPI0015D3988B|nr:hypothetical protein [Mycobacterium lacus]MCV7123133.1 hypothetical protein [Mycobacterium lacus]